MTDCCNILLLYKYALQYVNAKKKGWEHIVVGT